MNVQLKIAKRSYSSKDCVLLIIIIVHHPDFAVASKVIERRLVGGTLALTKAQSQFTRKDDNMFIKELF